MKMMINYSRIYIMITKKMMNKN